jgi:hypothetical protein
MAIGRSRVAGLDGDSKVSREKRLKSSCSTVAPLSSRAGAARSVQLVDANHTVSVEAQVEDVQHFAVETSVLAAVVKGTKFTVHAGKTGAAVSVQRGHVEVDDHRNGSHVLISIGQSASIDLAKGNDLTVVEGSGSAPAVTSENASPGPDFGVTSTPDSPAGGGPANAGNGKGNSGSGNGNCGPNGKHSSGNGGI